MTNQDFIDYLLSVIEDKEISFTDSILDKSKEKTICAELSVRLHKETFHKFF